MEELLQLEKDLSFISFDHEDAYHLGQMLVDKVNTQNLKPLRIRIVLNHDIVFQYLMNGKNGEEWLNRKQKTVEMFEHSSYYIWTCQETNHQYDKYLDDDSMAICGGGFPLIMNDEIIGCCIVSGLQHDQDHQIIVDCLKELKRKKEDL